MHVMWGKTESKPRFFILNQTEADRCWTRWNRHSRLHLLTRNGTAKSCRHTADKPNDLCRLLSESKLSNCGTSSSTSTSTSSVLLFRFGWSPWHFTFYKNVTIRCSVCRRGHEAISITATVASHHVPIVCPNFPPGAPPLPQLDLSPAAKRRTRCD